MDPLAKHGNCETWYGSHARFDCISCGASYTRDHGAWIVRRPTPLFDRELSDVNDPDA